MNMMTDKIHVCVRMLSFPYISLQIIGVSSLSPIKCGLESHSYVIKIALKVNETVLIAVATKSTNSRGNFAIIINNIKEENLVDSFSISDLNL